MHAPWAFAVAGSLLLLSVAAPGAAACSRIPTPGFLHLQWIGPDRVFGNLGDQAGFYTLSNRTFEPVAFGNAWRGTVGTDPEGRWVAVASGDTKVTRGQSSACEYGWGTTEVIDAEAGDQRKLMDLAALTFAAGPRELLVAHGDLPWAVLYAWGRWSEPRALDGAGGSVATADGVRAAAFSPDGRTLALAPDGRLDLVVVDAASGRPRHPPVALPEGTAPQRLAFNPAGDHLALVAGVPNGTVVRVARVAEGALTWVGETFHAERIVAAAWGQAGLALVRDAGRGPSANATLLLYPQPERFGGLLERDLGTTALGGLAWSPDGARLALGGKGLRLFDAQLRSAGVQDAGGPTGPPPFAPLKDLRVEPVQAVSAASGTPAERPLPFPSLLALLVLGLVAAATARKA